MAEKDFAAQEFGTGNNTVAAALVTGYGGKISSFEPAIHALLNAGHDVVAYEYHDDVLASGRPEDLTELVDAVHADFQWRTADYAHCRHAGVSMGMGIALNMQRQTIGKKLPAVYAGGGTSVAGLIARNPLFYGVHKAFWRNGHNEASLREIWAELHHSPNAPFAVALGGLDYIVSYRKALRTMREWQKDGTPIAIKTLPQQGHQGTVRWYKNNIPAMLSQADGMIETR